MTRSYKSRYNSWYRLIVIGVILTMVFGSQSFAVTTSASAQSAPAPAALTNTLTLNVISARSEPLAFDGAGVSKGAPITQFKYIINVDNTGTTEQRSPADGCSPEDPDYPASCHWTSVAGVPGSSPIYTQGDETDFAGGLTLPDGRYLISVRADGFKLDGAHFTVPLSGSGQVTVEMQPTPLPTATVRARIFEDISPTNSAPDDSEHGLAGFVGHIYDYIDEVTTDVFGNPLCTEYDSNQNPIPGTGGQCVSDANGDLVIPNLGPNRYALAAVPPDGSNWIQTTTLEGNHDWDAWVMEGATGYDTEFVVAGEPFPATFFGFVSPTPMPASGASGGITGVVMASKVYVPAQGGLSLPGTVWGGMAGQKLDKPIVKPWISLVDLQNGDTAIYIGQGDENGNFSIPNVPDGNYSVTYWDEAQDYILDFVNVTVSNGETADMGILPLTGWWTTIEGHVYNDLNFNGKMDPGEPGISNFPVVMKKRENSLMDRGAVAVTTDASGYYFMENAYPMTQWLVQEAYADQYYTTGVTYQSDNQPTETTILGAGVDISVLPIIGLGARIDWGVHAYDPAGNNGVPKNGGIVGSVTYDTTRNELDPRFSVTENWQPGIPNLTVNLYKPQPCPSVIPVGQACDATRRYLLAADGSFAKGQLLNQYITETWERPTGCVARDVDGNPLTYPNLQQVLPTDPNAECLEGPLMGNQLQTGFSTVDGNYGFADGCFGPGGATGPETCADGSDPANSPLPAADYLVQVEIPNDALGRPLYKVTNEEAINIFTGDEYVPQIPPSECAGPLHTVDVAGVGTDNYGPVALPNGIVVAASSPVDNADFADGGGSPFEGTQRPLCDTKLIRVSNGRSVAPGFNLFTDVPIPGRFWGLMVDDLNFSSDPKSLLYGEKAGVPFAPIGVYDYTNRLVTTVESDYNGLFDVLLPSTNRISCPTPSGVCANLYRLVGNDPGVPGKLNLNYKPQFRTISAEFEAFPGLIVPADLAPTQVGVSIQLPGSQFGAPVACTLDAATPQLFAVSKPYADISNGAGSFTITGQGFGASQGAGQVTLDGTIVLPVTSWSDTQIAVTVPATTAFGVHQLDIKADNGQKTVNGLTFHVLGTQVVVGAFPSNAVLDNFNRNNPSLILTGNWLVDNIGFTVTSNYLRIQTGNNGNSNIRNAWWTDGSAFGANQEAYFTFTQVSNQSGANEQGLLLKYSGGSTPVSTNARWIEVAYNNTPANTVRIRTKSAGSGTVTDQATLTGVTFGTNDQLGARALSDGTVIVYRNGGEVGRTTIPTTAAWTGRIGLRFEGTGNSSSTEARIDNFGGGNVSVTATGYQPNLYEVGSGHSYAIIQDALDAAANSNGDDLVVVYPGQPDLNNPRANPRGAYYENIIISSPVKLQGVGPGGVYADGTFIPGSIIDGAAFGGDTDLANAWRAKVAGMAWDGNQTVYEAQTVYVLARNGQFTAAYKASIDGFDLRGGDQGAGFPNNINQIGGTPTGLPPAVAAQGGAIFANAYAQNLQITNNVVQNNSGSYGAVRIGTPNLPQPDTNQHNENVRIANNRVIANAGTNLAGGIGLFAGSDNYEVANNDICGNFSAEYGGGVSVYGFSPNGKIHHNRIYFNRSYDEAGGVMIAGELPTNPAVLSPGSGPVDIYNNLIQANMANDDGGGVRFLMAGNFPMNVYNNMIVNNVSTHEGGGIGINDAPDVRVYNNTIMKNITTATALTSNGQPAPAGLSTSANSDLLQATLPGGSPLFSDPLLFNNIFWDNRAGTRATTTVIGLGAAGDPNPINNWDMGVADGTGLVSPTNSLLQVTTGTNASPTNQVGVDPMIIAAYDTSVAFNSWRTNPNFIGAIMVATELPANLMGNYRITDASSATDGGAASKSGVNAPAFDFENQARPAGAGIDIGADELVGGTPVNAFPNTTLLDNFNRANGGLGANWAGNTSQSNYRINSNEVQVRNTGSVNWRTAFGANQEAYFTFTQQIRTNVAEQSLILKLIGSGPNGSNASLIAVTYNPTNNTVIVRTKTRSQGWVTRATFNVTFTANQFTQDTFGARALSDGTVTVFKNGAQIGTTNVTSGATPWPTSLAQGGGKIGVWFNSNNLSGANDARFDNFGGGTMP